MPASETVSKRVERVFLGWDASLLDAAVAWLARRAGDVGENKSPKDSSARRLPRPLIALPSGRAVDRLRGRLDEEPRLGVDSADVVTVGSLLSKLLPTSEAFASAFEQTLAWTKVLRSASEPNLRLVTANPPAEHAIESWLEIASSLRQLHSDVAAQTWMFSDVVEHARSDVESKRWRALTEWQSQYLRVLADVGRVDLDAHSVMNLRSTTITLDQPILLVGTLDLPPLIEKLLQTCAGYITSLIGMPASLRSGLNDLGGLKEEAWQNHIVASLDDHFVPAQDVTDQSHAVMESLSEFGRHRSVDEITIGVTDASLIEPIEAHCALLEVPTYRHLGTPFLGTSVGRLLDLVCQHLESRSYASLAALVRHAGVHAALDDHLSDPSGEWLVKLDEVMANHFPLSVEEPLPPACPHTDTVNQLIGWVDEWLAPLLSKTPKASPPTGTDKTIKQQRLSDGCECLREVLMRLESGESPTGLADGPRVPKTDRTRQTLDQVLDAFQRIPASMDPIVDGATATRIVKARLADIRIPSDPAPEQIEILGWLDLALDDARAMVVAGFNHPFVPEATRSEPFLPNALRQSWQQTGNAKRYARDVVAMHQILAKRQYVRMIVGQFAADGSPTPPSRLLSATDPNTAARRVCNLLESSRPRVKLEPAPPSTDEVPGLVTPTNWQKSDFYQLPKPEAGRTVSHLSVTSFSAYLTCPYRFYLRYVLGLRPVDDLAMELAANQFGDLVHGALEWFGETDAKDATDENRVREALFDELNRYAQTHYGDNAATTIAMQVRQAQRRLRALARQQTQRAQQGWIMAQVEASVDENETDRNGNPKSPSGLWVDEEFMGIRGRFDRIDHHPDSGRWAILDYKTHAFTPEKKHLKKEGAKTQWIDLQLPLYRRLIPDLGIHADPADVDLGYFNVADKDADTKVNLARFSEEQFAEADERMHWCVRQIRACRFEPTDQRVPFDDYAEIVEGLA
ncbi:MAG: PD-(D/E)XK nuclease family protein [Planctomycetota bacterium]